MLPRLQNTVPSSNPASILRGASKWSPNQPLVGDGNAETPDMSGRVLVTGGAGFIGSHIAEAYLGEGWEVVVLDDLSRGQERNVPKGARFVRADIRSPEARQTIASGRFDVVNHHAAQIDVRVSVDQPAFDSQINVVGLVNLLEGAGQGGVRRFILNQAVP